MTLTPVVPDPFNVHMLPSIASYLQSSPERSKNLQMEEAIKSLVCGILIHQRAIITNIKRYPDTIRKLQNIAAFVDNATAEKISRGFGCKIIRQNIKGFKDATQEVTLFSEYLGDVLRIVDQIYSIPNQTNNEIITIITTLQKYSAWFTTASYYSSIIERESRQELATALISIAKYFESATKNSPGYDIAVLALSNLPAKESEEITHHVSIIREFMQKIPSLGLDAFAKWINTKHVTLEQLKFHREELRALVPHLTYLNFGNMPCDEDFLLNLIDSCECLEYLTTDRVQITGRCLKNIGNKTNLLSLAIHSHALREPLNLLPLKNLRKLDLAWCSTFNQPLDLSNLTNLCTFRLMNCCSFNQPLNFSSTAQIQSITLHQCDAYNHPFVLENLPKLTKVEFKMMDTFNQPIVLSGLPKLEKFSFQGGLQIFNSTITLRALEKLKFLDLVQLCDFNTSFDLKETPNLERLRLSNLRSFNQPLDFTLLSRLKQIKLSYCQQFNQPLDLRHSLLLETFSADYCESLNQPIFFNVDALLKTFSLTDCHAYAQAIDISGLKEITTVKVYGSDGSEVLRANRAGIEWITVNSNCDPF